MRAERTDFHSLNRHLQIVGRTCGRSKMQHRSNRTWHINVPADVLAAEPKLGMSHKVANIGIAAGDQIV